MTYNSPTRRPAHGNDSSFYWIVKTAKVALIAGVVCTIGMASLRQTPEPLKANHHHHSIRHLTFNRDEQTAIYGTFPKPGDPFHFIPCTDKLNLPALNDSHPEQSWAQQYSPNPKDWEWGQGVKGKNKTTGMGHDPYAGRGIYLCGYLDVPMDYTNESDHRIARLYVGKYQVSGLARADGSSGSSAGQKSKRTLVLHPGGPGGSGMESLLDDEGMSAKFSDGEFDVFSLDPRGTGSSLPSGSCFPHDPIRDRMSTYTGVYRKVSPSPIAQIEIADAMNAAIFESCVQRLGDFGRFLSTTFVARDLEQIRQALGEEELTSYLVSYGTAVAEVYTSLFPSRVGRMILDAVVHYPDETLPAGFAVTSLDRHNYTWRDGFLRECVDAGPANCALAAPVDGRSVTVDSLESRMDTLFEAIAKRPVPASTESDGPTLVTYSNLGLELDQNLYFPYQWKDFAKLLADLEVGEPLRAAERVNTRWWFPTSYPYSPNTPPYPQEVLNLVICADSSHTLVAPESLQWWDSLWANTTAQAPIGADFRFYLTLPCQQYSRFWGRAAEVFRGPLNETLNYPVLLVSASHDPATPRGGAMQVYEAMGERNARFVNHNGYGHGTRDPSTCTNDIMKAYIKTGALPAKQVTTCYADKKPFAPGYSS